MATCDDCLHYDICVFHLKGDENKRCPHFKNKSAVVEVETVKAWLCKMAINNLRNFAIDCTPQKEG